MRKKDKFGQIREKLVQNSYELHRNFCIPILPEHIRSYGILSKFVRISYEFCTNFT